MEIIDKKKWPPAKWSNTRGCRRCESALGLSIEDVFYHMASRTGDNYAERENYKCYYFTCPVCKAHNQLASYESYALELFGKYWMGKIPQKDI